MIGKIVLVLSALALARAQIPSLGFCPDYVPMANFDMNRFLGVWYETERYFQLTEVVSRCVMANYTLSGGKFHVSNQVTNRFTGIKRVVDGEIKKAASKAEEGKLIVKYTIPLTPETKYNVLETDYDNYAVLWSCSGIGPFHTQNAWVMTRERLAPGPVIQKAYAVLDKYKISRTFFVKTDQNDCAYSEPEETKPGEAAPSVEDADKNPEKKPEKDSENVRTAAMPEPPQLVVEVENPKDDKELAKNVLIAEDSKKPSINTVPERIMEVAEAMKDEQPADIAEEKKELEKETAAKIVKQTEKTV
ncbi:apolipoprotein D-like [Hylaeus volcanicus]|uniref:apolipoprotein D-like n=1 Tax=Hylaeus volcanicus TaxID=313075 RepID=UPI0023B83ACA|nr:apolipoprotein D-like [Hylaeus volcanicus]XP_053978720.1 apolipoprotein D-like [Hylaeus volcanicus]XP_053978721.1 apolipoprotein D-like [Hylaeus volcanicus]